MAKHSLVLLLLILCSILLLMCFVILLIDYSKHLLNISNRTWKNVNVEVGINIVDHLEKNNGENIEHVSVKSSKMQRAEKNCRENRKINFTPYIPKYMLDLYDQLNLDLNLSIPVIDVVKSLIPKRSSIFLFINTFNRLRILTAFKGEQYIREYLKWDHLIKNDSEECSSLLFDLPKSNTDEELIRSELRILSLIKNPNIISVIERFVRVEYTNSKSHKNFTIDAKILQHFANKWEVFDVSKAVASAVSDDSNNKMTEITLTVCVRDHELNRNNGNLKISVQPSGENCEHDYPILLLSYRSGAQKDSAPQDGVDTDDLFAVRKANAEGEISDVGLPEHRFKRQTDEYYGGIPIDIDNENYLPDGKERKHRRLANHCRRKPLYVDFADINYDTWIVQPSGYEAYQCSGRCFYPISAHLTPTKHAVLQTLLHSVNPVKAPRCSCIPTRLDSISLLYIDSNGVLTYRYAYKEMVVGECGCR